MRAAVVADRQATLENVAAVVAEVAKREWGGADEKRVMRSERLFFLRAKRAAADEEAAKPDENAGKEDEAAWSYESTKEFNDTMREFANRDWKLAEAEEAVEQEVDEVDEVDEVR